MDGWDRVIAAVIDRRSQLGWTQKRLAAEAGVAERTVQNLEGGKRTQPLNRSKIERALGWQVGEMRRIAESGEAPPDPIGRELRQEIIDLLGPRRAAPFLADLEAHVRGEPPPGTSGDAAGRHAEQAAAS